MIDIAPFTLDAKPEPTPEQLQAAANNYRAAVDMLNDAEQSVLKLDMEPRLYRRDGWKTGFHKPGYWEAEITRKV